MLLDNALPSMYRIWWLLRWTFLSLLEILAFLNAVASSYLKSMIKNIIYRKFSPFFIFCIWITLPTYLCDWKLRPPLKLLNSIISISSSRIYSNVTFVFFRNAYFQYNSILFYMKMKWYDKSEMIVFVIDCHYS